MQSQCSACPAPFLWLQATSVFPLIHLKEQSYWLALIAGCQLSWQLVGHRFFLGFFKTAALLMPYKREVVSCQESHDKKAFACKQMCLFQFSPSRCLDSLFLDFSWAQR